ncbi:hypothetical protein FCM35_KLT00510 [Carex littledalei]|uniref:Uncharacterized protein n=1 Tax=Carex littledalei TaxID=544730 RepID=A0A833RM88_9POAL|nr:hypothetical protein FCM35_KLT00510 [Carex littledalei]
MLFCSVCSQGALFTKAFVCVVKWKNVALLILVLSGFWCKMEKCCSCKKMFLLFARDPLYGVSVTFRLSCLLGYNLGMQLLFVMEVAEQLSFSCATLICVC